MHVMYGAGSVREREERQKRRRKGKREQNEKRRQTAAALWAKDREYTCLLRSSIDGKLRQYSAAVYTSTRSE